MPGEAVVAVPVIGWQWALKHKSLQPWITLTTLGNLAVFLRLLRGLITLGRQWSEALDESSEVTLKQSLL